MLFFDELLLRGHDAEIDPKPLLFAFFEPNVARCHKGIHRL